MWSVDLAAVKAEWAPGVSCPSPAFGISGRELMEMAESIGQKTRVKIVTVSEYNPAIEKFKTGTLVNQVFYSLLVGLAKKRL